jgi:formate dehydrogenase (coenzyme F420) beta subunit
MELLINKSKELLESGRANVVIGYGEGTAGRVRAIFVKDPAKTSQYIYDDRCNQNLTMYLPKHEVKHLGKIAIVVDKAALRSILVLAAEHQLKDGELIALLVNKDGSITELNDFKSIEDYLATLSIDLTPEESNRIKEIESMTMEQRWAFWHEEFSKCIKCYACRQACPMCYCPRCTVEINKPQWISVPSHPLGNYEWHMMRAFHLAGRCINCGECAKACPMEIPLNLLTYKMIGDINEFFKYSAGMKHDTTYVLSTFKNEDKETFIR